MTTDETSASAEATPDTDGATEAVSSGKTPRVGLHSMLTRDTDMASRPGFRSPSNKRSKAQSKAKAKKGRNKKKRR
jgi:hypothetical protein